MLKKLLIHTRRSIKLINLISIALLIILGIVSSFYKISYSVSVGGEVVGYTDNKSKLQKQINDYMENGESEHTAFVQVDTLPEYDMCLLKRNESSNDEEIFDLIKSDGTPYYRYYAILENQQEKIYVPDFSTAESIVTKLKEKKSTNTDKITIAEKYETKIADFTSTDDAVSKLYVAPKKVTVAKTTVNRTSTGSVNTASNVSGAKVDLGISLIKPISGIITSRFGVRSNIRVSSHTGLDIAASTGTPIIAAAGGTVTFSGWKGSYGYMIVVTHANGVQTYYAHCSKLYYQAGQTVAQGQTIAAVGSTGNSTGPHLHFEIRKNGIAYNPQNYLY